jgi:AraC family transcriptional regulator
MVKRRQNAARRVSIVKDDTLQTYRHRVLRVLLYIQEHLDGDLTRDSLAKIGGFSPYHFHRIFRAMVGEPVHKHVRRLRLEAAAVKLTQSAPTVTELAFDAGYETHEAFTRAFKARFGVPPSKFRLARENGRDIVERTVEIKNVPEQRIAFVRHIGPYDEVGAAWGELMTWAAPKGLIGPNAEMLGVSYDDPGITTSGHLRYDAALKVGDDAEAEGGVGIRTLRGGDYAVVRHHGPYDRLGDSYEYVYGTWVPASGRALADAPPFEVYLNNPSNTAPEDLLTDLHIPLKQTG